MTILFDGRSMRRKAGVVMITFRLTKVVIPNTLEEDHKDRPCYKEQDSCSGWINKYANAEPGITGRQPGNG